MNQLSQKFKFVTVVAALIALSACSSSQVEEGAETSAETTADVSLDQATPTAATDEVPALDPAATDSMAAAPEAVPASDPALETPPATEGAAVTPTDAPVAEVAPTDAPVSDAPVVAPVVDAPMTDLPVAEAPVTETAPVAEVATATEGSKYKVKRGDTLMKIAFEQYGDLYRWREIYESNRGQIKDFNHVPPGTELTLSGAGMVTIEKNGESYLIKRGDTLGTISNDVFGTTRKWKKLWENNRQLIKDPNKIYAGFYLYYQPEGKLTREEVAPALKKEDSAMNTETQVGTAPRQPASNPTDTQAPAKN